MKKTNVKEKISKIKFKKREKVPYSDAPIQIRLVVSEDEEHAEALERAALHVDGVKKVKSSRSPEDEVFETLNGSDRREQFRFEPNNRYFSICVYAFFFIIAATLVIVGITKVDILKNIISRFLSVISPFIGGIFLAFVLDPIVEWLDNHLFLNVFKIKKAALRKILALLATYLFMLGLVVVLLRYVIPQVGSSIMDLYSKRDTLTSSLQLYIARLEDYFPSLNGAYFEAKLNEMLPQVFAYLTNLAPKILSLSVSIAMFAFNVLLGIMISVYALYDKRKLKLLVLRLSYSFMSIGKATRLSQTTNECASIFGSFVSGKSLDSLIIGVLCFIILTVFGFPYAILVSVIVGVTNMIPYFGPFIGAVPGILLYLCVSPMDALAFAVIILILQQFDGWVLGPKILGDSTGLSPLWVIFAITVGGAYAGVLGMFLGVPVVAVFAHLANRFITARLEKRKIDVS